MKICLYSPVDDEVLFERVGFYRDDLKALSISGDDVVATNKISSVLHFKPDLLVGYFYSRSVFVALLCRLIGSKVILTGGADQISPILNTGKDLFFRRLFGFLALLISHKIYLSCSEDVHNFKGLAFGFKFLSSKIKLVNHVVVPLFPPVEKRLSNSSFNAITLCWMGSKGNVQRKGVDKAIELVCQLCILGVDARLKIAGTDGPGRYYLEDIIKKFKMEDRVTYLGAISEIEKVDLFKANDVYLQLSKHEGFGVAAAEAFFSGLVVIHSNKGGLKDVIGDHGIVIDPDNLDSLKIKKLYDQIQDYKVDLSHISFDIKNYSIEARAEAFLGDNRV